MSAHPIQTAPARVSLLRSILAFTSLESVPILRPKMLRRDTSEGLIAPRSPVPTVSSPVPRHPASPFLQASTFPLAPPRSPGPRVQEIDVPSQISSATNFKLDTPPRRSTTPLMTRQASTDALGLGISLRRTASTLGKED